MTDNILFILHIYFFFFIHRQNDHTWHAHLKHLYLYIYREELKRSICNTFTVFFCKIRNKKKENF